MFGNLHALVFSHRDIIVTLHVSYFSYVAMLSSQET